MSLDSADGGDRAVSPSRGRSRALAVLVLLGVAAAGAVAVGLAVRGAQPPLPGLPDPGEAVRVGLPAVRVAAEVLAVLVLGALVAAVVLVPDPDDRGRAARWAGRLSGCWALLALAMVLLTVSDSMSMPPHEVLTAGHLFPGIGMFTAATAWLVVAHAAALVWLWEKFAVPAVGLLCASVIGVAPVALTGHSSAGGDHDWATDSLMAHVLAAAVWVGGLVAVLVVAGARRHYAVRAIRLYSAIALACWLVIAATGVVNAFLRVRPTDLWTTDYGALLLAKTAAILVLGALGYLHRVRTIPRVEAGRFSGFLRVGAVEVLLMLVTVGIAVGLARSPGPGAEPGPGSTTRSLLGYGLPDRPSMERMLTQWRPDLVFGTLAVVAAVWYLAALRGRASWPVERTLSWLAGCLVLGAATSSGLGKYEPAVLSAHLVLQVLVGVVAPILLARGRPLALARVEPAGWPRLWVAAAVFAVPPALLYVLGLYDGVAGQHWARLLLLAWSLAAGLVLFSAPVPRRAPVMLVSAVYLATGLALLAREAVLGQAFFAELELGWRHDGAGIQSAAGWVAVTAAVVVAVYAGSLGARRDPEPESD
ncbi:CopD family protein [Actinokineospora pegani]|uniref:CopD family protein n=1 Tax=Actinokineospora pegani TaxID=2654637 RepID=UPI0012EAC8C7|nr:CopD family protein [Actinokineospora pegani]